MPWLPIFIDEDDKKVLLNWLNTQSDIAYLVSVGIKRWKAVNSVDDLPDGSYQLWHTASGNLPLISNRLNNDEYRSESNEPLLNQYGEHTHQRFIVDPWSGWTEEVTGADSSMPVFGAGHIAIITLEIHTRYELYSEGHEVEGVFVKEKSVYEENTLGLSGFSWIGSHYEKPPQQMHEWWEHLKHWIANNAKELARFPAERDEDSGELREEWGFYAFPSAYRAVRNGMKYCDNGFDLSAEFRDNE